MPNESPISEEENELIQNQGLEDLVATALFGFNSFAAASSSEKSQIRTFLEDFVNLVSNIENVIKAIQNKNVLFPEQEKVIRILYNNRGILDEFVKGYTQILDFRKSAYEQGYDIFMLVDQVYPRYLEKKSTDSKNVDESDYIREQFKLFGYDENGESIFVPYFEHIDTYSKIKKRFFIRENGKFRPNTPPTPIARWQCRIGSSTFYVPPTSINVSQVFKTTSFGGAIRQANTPKMNTGHSETQINITLYFPNHENIWGFRGDKADFNIFNWDPNPVLRSDTFEVYGQKELVNNATVPDHVIDKYLSSLRGLITQFKYAPFLPIKNEYLNRTYGITGVALTGLTISTMEQFPFVLVANLQLSKFNFTPLMPMLDDFDQAIHWGKFRQYMGKAAARLDGLVNQGFLVRELDKSKGGSTTSQNVATYEGDLLPQLNKLADITNGANFDFYFPVSTPSRIFAPDTTDFRQPSEDNVVTSEQWSIFIFDILGFDLVSTPQFNFFEYDRAYKNKTIRGQRRVLWDWMQSNKIALDLLTPENQSKFIEYIIKEGKKTGHINSSNEQQIREDLKTEWFFMIYELILNDNPRFKQLIDSRKYANSDYTINEWKVPMEKLTIDWANCLVQSVRVSLSNRFAPLQVQLQDEPTMQHIGGGDSNVEVSMIIIGEDNLIRFRRLFEHVNGLARLEKAHGVLGFLGIKNVVTSLCGIKYVLPLSFEADTIPNYPHAYNVVMSFVDFDIMQQERERLSSEQQKYLVEQFGKRNPFLRLKQTWGLFSAYPDMPLDVRDENGEIIGHLDPDWYFRSFNTTNSDSDLFQWSLDADVVDLIKRYAEIEAILMDSTTPIEEKSKNQAIAEALEQKAISIVNQGGALPPGWEIRDGHLRPLTEMDVADERGLIQIQYLGAFDEDKPDMISFIALFEGGTFRLGQENVRTNKREYVTGLSLFQEDNASVNLKGLTAIPGSVSYEKYQNEYIDKGSSPARQYESMMHDFLYRSLKGRMVKAFPTYMLWLIDEGGRFAGIKLFDNFYGLNSVIDFSVLQSEDSVNDTLVLRLSNIYQKLTTPYKDVVITEDDPLYDTPIGRMIVNAQNRDRNLRSGLTDEIIELNNIRLKPGVRIHLRMGYGSNPNALQTVFNGTIAEVEQGDIITVIAQSDAVELTAFVNTSNQKGHSGTLDGGINTGFWLSEPRDLIVRLLSMGSSNFKEWVSWGSKGVLFSESRFGIRHFGTILYEEMTKAARIATKSKSIYAAKALSQQRSGDGTVASFQAMLGDYTKDLSEISNIANLSNAFSPTLLKIGQALWLNSLSKRDYEVFKRNIYPGNGSGIAQFMGGDLIDAGVTMSQVVAYYKSQDNDKSETEDSSGRSWWEQPNRPARSDEDNKRDLKNLWNYFESSAEATDEELIKLQESANTGAPDLEVKKEDSPGLIDMLFTGTKIVANTMFPSEYLKNALGGVLDFSADITSFGIPVLSDINHFVADIGSTSIGDILGGTKRLMKSPLGRAVGLWSMNDDDDLAGYDEVSFRAQTYMKTVWDLFKVCAALLPNYIIAVRPFEDRSTLFYGKPHWLYTSGVIPVTTGIPRDSKPDLEDPDFGLNDLLKTAKQSTSQELDRLNKLAEDSQLLRNILQFNPVEVDPYTSGVASTDEEKNMAIAAARQAAKADYVSESLLNAFLGAASSVSLSNIPLKVIQEDIFAGIVGVEEFHSNAEGRVEGLVKQYVEVGNAMDYDTSALVNFLEEFESQQEAGIYTQGIFETLLTEINTIYGLQNAKNAEDIAVNPETGLPAVGAGNLPSPEKLFEVGTNIANTVTNTDASQILEVYKNDPLGFAYNFGWKYSSIPVRVDPMTGYGTDTVGSLAYSIYGGSFGLQSRSISEADSIWDSIRTSLRDDNQIHEVFDRIYPTESDKFNEFYDLFLRFLWQDPFNRAWPVIVLERDDNGVLDTAGRAIPGVSDAASYNWNPMRKLWTIFITSRDISVDENNIVHAAAARRYMEQNRKPGSKADTIWENYTENISDWWDQNIGQVLGLITDTITGFVASIRLSLTQMSTALSIASKAQVQANILNGILNDSIYYQEGREGSILRLVDNPFTREYGEPVIEVREPFQRLHYVSSFDSILDNQIRENINNVATVVTAVSDGAHPVTVHLDKGVPPDRQVEKTVETGLFWDNTFGSGLFGFLQPLLHPIETLRGYAKLTTGSSDELSSRRVALYHLRESLKDIYTGEITILGNADIRPHDLVYIADVYERMYGLVEVEQIIHHFTPESGFVTAITPNALVTVNDPVKWTFLSWIWSKMHSYNLRDDVRAALSVKAERNVAAASSYLEKDDIYKNFGVQLNGGIQWTHGNSALVRDVGAMFTANGVSSLSKRDDVWNQVQTIDIGLNLLKSGATVGGAVIGAVTTGPTGAIVGGAGAWAITDLLWQGWQWVKENLLDQHGCYIQYLNKDGQPMDAGLSYFQGVAVGTNHTVSLFPNIVGIRTPVKEDGHYRITTDDLLASLGWTEVETVALFRETSMYVNQINEKILTISGRDPIFLNSTNSIVLTAQVLDPYGESTGGNSRASGVVDGDTLNVRVIDGGESGIAAGTVIKVRLSLMNAYELEYYDNPYTDSVNEALRDNPTNDLGRMAVDYLVNRFSRGINRYIAIRVDKFNQYDTYGRLIGVVFINAPLGTTDAKRLDTLKKIASRSPAVAFDAYLEDGRPYTLNWELVMTGYGNIDMRESLWNTGWRSDAINYYSGS